MAAIRVFEEAARSKNFTVAAEKLGMTQAAVSYQIKVLEDRVGAQLFVRQARGVELSEIGRKFAGTATEALNLLADAYADARGLSQDTLSISVIPTFGTNFLAQHLGKFQLDNPKIAVRVEISEGLTDFNSDEFDLAIRGGKGEWPDLRSHILIPTQFTPMLSKELSDSIGGVREPADLLKLPILSHSDPWWQLWFNAAGLENQSLDNRPNRQFGPQILEANAAIAGQGVAMLTPAFFKAELARGQLVQPFDLLGDDGTGYWLVFPESNRLSPKIRKFRSWIEAATASYRE
ncbi:LysR family glycine cleavage system transcriptional activator [Labrenzia sp. EL_208]|nr:LysR family glycine cleavage system transcriptional activator [Labrenzia sp. EL_132]MBG6210949.1 LysR family glycine cleavage system transcriptional activator [Labrenzia sp. EL_126]MBG6233234.1 LysR family glycine cleavage system transcriptional activator [Labrenzia sp. EL_208]